MTTSKMVRSSRAPSASVGMMPKRRILVAVDKEVEVGKDDEGEDGVADSSRPAIIRTTTDMMDFARVCA